MPSLDASIRRFHGPVPVSHSQSSIPRDLLSSRIRRACKSSSPQVIVANIAMCREGRGTVRFPYVEKAAPASTLSHGHDNLNPLLQDEEEDKLWRIAAKYLRKSPNQ